MKILLVAHFDRQSASVLLQSVGPVDIVLAALITGSTNLTWVLVVWSIPNFGEAVRERDSLLVPSVALILSLLISAILAPWKQTVAVILYGGVYLAVGIPKMIWDRMRNRKPGRETRRVPVRWQATVTLIFGVALAWLTILGSDQPWLPAERLEFTSGKDIAGYVLSENGSSLTLLLEDDRSVARISVDTVEHRDFCDYHDVDERSVLALLMSMEQVTHKPCV